jgi:hypothetical protein
MIRFEGIVLPGMVISYFNGVFGLVNKKLYPTSRLGRLDHWAWLVD